MAPMGLYMGIVLQRVCKDIVTFVTILANEQITLLVPNSYASLWRLHSSGIKFGGSELPLAASTVKAAIIILISSTVIASGYFSHLYKKMVFQVVVAMFWFLESSALNGLD